MISRFVRLIPTRLLYLYESFLLRNYKRTKKFLTSTNPRILEEISRKKALQVFKIAARNVPAYKKFLEEHNINPDEIRTIEDFKKVPITTKENYIRKYTYEERCIQGRFPPYGNIDESSGSSGTPVNWIHSKEEVERLAKAAQFEYQYTYNPTNKRYIIIGAWSMGAWTTGVKFAEIIENFSIVKSIGPDVDKIVNTIKTFGKEYNYLIGAYPPFIKKLVDEGSKKIRWKDYKIDFVTGGEPFIEEWRDYIRRKIGNPDSIIISSYGASDIDIGIAFETPFSIFIRKLAKKNKVLRKEIFGSLDVDPVIFQYDITEHYIENIKKKGKPTFHITLLNPVVASPKVKYCLEDEGKTISFDKMLQILRKFVPGYMEELQRQGLKKEDILRLPFLFVSGRIDETVSIDGANVYPTHIYLSLSRDEELHDITNSFKISTKFDEKQNFKFYLLFELKKGIKPSKKLREKYHRTILRQLIEINDGFKESYLKDKKAADPHVLLYPYHTGPFKEYNLIKRKYIFKPVEVAVILFLSFILSSAKYMNFLGNYNIVGNAFIELPPHPTIGYSLLQLLVNTLIVFSVLMSFFALIKSMVPKRNGGY